MTTPADFHEGQQVAMNGDGPFEVLHVLQRRIVLGGYFGTEHEPGGFTRWPVEGDLLDSVEPWDPDRHPIEYLPWDCYLPSRDHLHYDPTAWGSDGLTVEELEGPQSARARLWGRIRRWWYRSGPWWSWTPPWRSR